MNRINIKQSGNWSDSNIWPGGIFPQPGDFVYANSNYVNIDTDIDIAHLTNEKTYIDVAGGQFTANNGVTIKANMHSGIQPLINFANNGSLTIIGNVEGSTEGLDCCIENTGTGTIHISGHVQGGRGGYVVGIKNLSTGTVDLTGTATMGLGGYSYGISNHQEGKIIINGVESTDNKNYGLDPLESTYL